MTFSANIHKLIFRVRSTIWWWNFPEHFLVLLTHNNCFLLRYDTLMGFIIFRGNLLIFLTRYLCWKRVMFLIHIHQLLHNLSIKICELLADITFYFMLDVIKGSRCTAQTYFMLALQYQYIFRNWITSLTLISHHYYGVR